MSKTLSVTNLRTGAKHDIPYTPYPDIKLGELFIRLPGSFPALVGQCEGRFDPDTGLFAFPDGYPQAMTRRGFPVYRRRDIGGDECLEVSEDEETEL